MWFAGEIWLEAAEWAMLEPACIALFIANQMVLVEKNSSRYMPPHSHAAHPNIEPCRVCGGKHSHHTITGAELRCDHKKQPPPQADMWQN